MFVLSVLALQLAHGVPLQVTQQGRVMDAAGASMSGSHTVVFRVYDDPLAGTKLWESVQTVHFTNGYYAAILGADEANNRLDVERFLHKIARQHVKGQLSMGDVEAAAKQEFEDI